MTTRPAPFGAGRNDHLHGDEDDLPELTDAEDEVIETRAREMLAERFADRDEFYYLLVGMDDHTIVHQLHRALMSLDDACVGKQIALDAIRSALSQIQALVHSEAERVWHEELVEQAERELREQVTA